MAAKQEAKTLTELLADLVAFKTVSGDNLSGGECLNYLEHYLGHRGMYLDSNADGFPYLVATTQPTKSPKILLQAHLDVVPCQASLFTLTEKDGKLFGRGVYDMKFAAAVFLKLADELQLSDYDFGIMLTFDEELGGAGGKNGVKALLEAGYRAKVCILPDAGDNWQIEATHKGAWIVRLSAKGIAAHGSRPWDGDNAIHRLIDALHEVSQLFKSQQVETDTLSINQIAGGRAANQVADAAEAILDVRFLSNELYEELRTRIESIAGKYKITPETVAHVKCVKTDMKNPYVVSFLEMARKFHGSPLKSSHSLGASDARYFAEFKIPTILLRPSGGGAHSDSEWIGKSDLEKYYQLIKAYVQKEARL